MQDVYFEKAVTEIKLDERISALDISSTYLAAGLDDGAFQIVDTGPMVTLDSSPQIFLRNRSSVGC